MLEEIALIVLSVSLLIFLYSLTQLKKPSYSGAGRQASTPSPDPTPTKTETKRAKIYEPTEMEDFEEEMVPESMPAPASDYRRLERLEVASAGPSDHFSGEMAAAQTFERKASLIYWERMCLEEEFDLTVSLHKPDFKVKSPDGASVHVSDDSYHLPKTGHVRVVPVCSACNISPAYRDMKVSDFDNETRADFKVLPLKEGKFDLNVEFQVVTADGQIQKLGAESVEVDIRKKPIDLNLGILNLSVSRRVPAFFSMCGSFFGLTTFVLARLGINWTEEIYGWSLTLGTGIAGAVMILLVLLLLFKGVRPLMNEISITLK
ncbi:hypothetical protein EU528_11140 [Candidatus Thorarchaeota archaeon]|nr:MAG: hypothetical protein EU528_11140 [Candidatus Thorarchaeota archaeon]